MHDVVLSAALAMLDYAADDTQRDAKLEMDGGISPDSYACRNRGVRHCRKRCASAWACLNFNGIRPWPYPVKRTTVIPC